MAGPYTGTIFSVEIFVKKDGIVPVWIRLEDRFAAKYRPVVMIGAVWQENISQPPGKLVGAFSQVKRAP